MQRTYTTPRLALAMLSPNDAAFIRELVNTPGWLKFIGERNVKTDEDAAAYIKRIIDNPDVTYWVARSINTNEPAGIITFIKRDYLDHPDIGFAFLPQYSGKGYAYEASNTVLNSIGNKQMLAITVKENVNSINLLEKLGFSFSKQFEHENETLLLYTKEA